MSRVLTDRGLGRDCDKRGTTGLEDGLHKGRRHTPATLDGTSGLRVFLESRSLFFFFLREKGL